MYGLAKEQFIGRSPIDLSPERQLDGRLSAEATLRGSEAKLNLVLDNVGAHIFIKDRQYRYTYVNKATTTLIGRRTEDIIGRTDGSFFDPQSVEEIMRSDRLVLEEGKTVTREETGLRVSDGSPRTYWTVKLPLRDPAGAVTGLCGISTDITERKKSRKRKTGCSRQFPLRRRASALPTKTIGLSM